MKLYSYFRSSASYRTRIALNLKGLEYDLVPVHLLKEGGEHKQSTYEALNPQKLLPTLVTDEGAELSQSLAIIEYLDEVYPQAKLLPGNALDRAYIRRLADTLAMEAQPLQNLRILQYLVKDLSATEAQKLDWIKHWVGSAMEAFEGILQKEGKAGEFCFGDQPTLADIVLVPQYFSAVRFNVDLTKCPKTVEIAERCNKLQAFIDAAPANQPDAE